MVDFAQVGPILDEAINRLAPEDQSAILLRSFEQFDFSSVGEALGSTEEAAFDFSLFSVETALSLQANGLNGSAIPVEVHP